MAIVREPTIQDEFKKSILQNPISDATVERQAEIILSRVRLSVFKSFPVSPTADQNGKVEIELGKGHLDNSYVSKLPLSLIKTAFAVIAQEANIPNNDIQGVMIVKQPGLLRNKVIVHIPSVESAEKIMSYPKKSQEETSAPSGLSFDMN